MYNITLIVGLPGSGKTTLAKSMLTPDHFLIDDPSRDELLFQNAIKSGKILIIICDPLLTITCESVVMSFLERKFGTDFNVEWIYFENDPVQAWKNHENRNKNDVRNLNKDFFNHMADRYHIPENAKTVLPVYCNKKSVDN